MGNAPSTTTATPEYEACAIEPASPHTASEREAWVMATAWYDDIVGTVRLATALPQEGERWRAMGHVVNDGFATVRHYEWVDFDFSGVSTEKLVDAIQAARASMTVWFALSCCPGFGGDENPVFWKRVFSVLMRSKPLVGPRTNAITYHGVVSDGVRFFNGASRPFPQVRVAWRDNLPWHLLWEPLKSRSIHARGLDRVLRRLRPFVLPSQWERGIAIAIRMEHQSIGLRALLGSLNPHDVSAYPTPTLRLVRIFFRQSRDDRLIQFVANPTDARIIVATQDVGRGSAGAYCQRTPLWRQLADRVVVDTLNLESCSSASTDLALAVCCSMLPERGNVMGLRVDTTHPLSETSGAWLGYAMFHPDQATGKSSLKNLTLRLGSHDEPAISALQRMAIGNNLTLSSEISTTYDLANIRAGTVVRSDPRQGVVIFEFTSTSWVTLCQKSTDPWVRIVLPGYGLAWIQSEDIDATESHPPAPSHIRRLKVVVEDIEEPSGSLTPGTKAPLLNLLSTIGDRLEYLHIGDHRGGGSHSLDASTVQSIMHRCPRLKSLRIRHDGSYWATSACDIASYASRLEELELTISDAMMPFDAPQLDHLKTLVIVARGSHKFASFANDVQSILSRYPQLVRFTWQQGIAGPHDRNQSGLQYEVTTATTRLLLGMRVSEESIASIPLRLEPKLAFVSAVQHHLTQSKAMARLPPEAIERIFSFSSSPVPRQLYIRDANQAVEPRA